MSTITQLDNEIQIVRENLLRLETERKNLEDAITAANALRPTGIPPSWKPAFDGIPPNVRVYAWYDPNKYGDRLAR